MSRMRRSFRSPRSQGKSAGYAYALSVVSGGLLRLSESWLLSGGQVVEVLFEGLVVLALDLQLGLEFLHQELETGNFGLEFEDVGVCGGNLAWEAQRARLGAA
jgi:hypothetical protein